MARAPLQRPGWFSVSAWLLIQKLGVGLDTSWQSVDVAVQLVVLDRAPARIGVDEDAVAVVASQQVVADRARVDEDEADANRLARMDPAGVQIPPPCGRWPLGYDSERGEYRTHETRVGMTQGPARAYGAPEGELTRIRVPPRWPYQPRA
jgi:hypothetical protein